MELHANGPDGACAKVAEELVKSNKTNSTGANRKLRNSEFFCLIAEELLVISPLKDAK